MWRRSVAACGLVLLAAGAAQSEPLPDGFVYLRDIDPTILQDMRYAGPHNFVGEKIDGYEAGECILTEPAAKGLKKAQDMLREKGLSLKVYDCYRPERAVAHFVRWAESAGDKRMKVEFYPAVDKTRVFALGYIARRSGHSRGSSVDLAAVKLPPPYQPDYLSGEPLTACTAPHPERYPDNSLDFGTGFDCFDALSHTWNGAIKGEAAKNRKLLVDVMANAGFSNYRKEWWHFDFKNPPFRKKYFDFPVTAHPDAIPEAAK